MLIAILCVTAVIGLWSVTPILVKIALAYVDPYTLTFLRLLQGLAIFVALFAVRKGSWKKLLHYDIWFVSGAVGLSVNYICFVLALQYTSAGAGGLVVQIQFVALAVLSALVLKEPMGMKKIAGIASAIGGVILVFLLTGGLSDAVRADYALGNTIMLASGLGWGIYALSNKALSTRLRNLEILIPMFIFALVVSAVFAGLNFEIRQPITGLGVFAIVALGVGSTGAGFLLMSEGLRRLSGTLVGTMTATTPLFTLMLAHLILGEELKPLMFVSAVLLLCGVATIVFAEREERRRNARHA